MAFSRHSQPCMILVGKFPIFLQKACTRIMKKRICDYPDPCTRKILYKAIVCNVKMSYNVIVMAPWFHGRAGCLDLRCDLVGAGCWRIPACRDAFCNWTGNSPWDYSSNFIRKSQPYSNIFHTNVLFRLTFLHFFSTAKIVVLIEHKNSGHTQGSHLWPLLLFPSGKGQIFP